jgi:hypothetical protein
MGAFELRRFRRPSWAALVFAITALLSSAPASAFTYLYCAAPTQCDKWDSNTVGTGAVVTWSLITDPVAINPQYQQAPPNDALTFISGTNQLATLRNTLGAASFDAAVQRAFDTWSKAANITFHKVADDGAQFAGSTAIDIRIGAFAFANGSTSGGAGFGPPYDDVNFADPLAGDIALNSLNRFVVDTNAEGTALPTDNGVYLNDIEGLFLHEIGHTLGLGHSDVANSIMCGYLSASFDGSLCDYTHVAHQLRADDLAGIQPLYGTPVPLPAAAWLMLSGLVGVGAVARRRRARPHDAG